MTLAVDRQLADLVRDLDQALELLEDTPPNGRNIVHLSARDRDGLLAALTAAAEFLHQLRSERLLRTQVPA